MKRIIEIEESLYNTIMCTPHSPVLGWHEIAQSVPYNPSEDCISREALKQAIENYLAKRQDVIIWETDMFDMLDNAPPVEQSIKVVCRSRNWSTDCTVTSGFEDGYRHGYRKAKEDVAKRIKEQYNEHHELIPYWLSVEDVKGGTE